jgi:hypothetical protein
MKSIYILLKYNNNFLSNFFCSDEFVSLDLLNIGQIQRIILIRKRIMIMQWMPTAAFHFYKCFNGRDRPDNTFAGVSNGCDRYQKIDQMIHTPLMLI